MSKYRLTGSGNSDERIRDTMAEISQRAAAVPPGACPLTVELALLQMAEYQTCGKCVPCRDGLPQLEKLLRLIVKCRGDETTYRKMVSLARQIRDTADCAIGYEAANTLLEGTERFKEEYESHIREGKCTDGIGQKIPCTELCPAHVDIPGYIALTAEEKYADAINLIRKDNPFPTACAMICEHPCEERCRRTILDSPVNIRGIKKFAVDQIPADQVAVPPRAADTGKSVAVIGGGPSGLTAAYYLALMGHRVVVFEGREQLGGMLRYGIPNYRFPKDRLDEDIRAILSAGNIEVKKKVRAGKDIPLEKLREEYDAVYVAIGAQIGKKLRLDGGDAQGVSSAVEMLEKIGDGVVPDYSGKKVIVIGGGNVAMDCARTSVRAGADEVTIVYRRRKDDMTALDTEIEGAVMEGVELMTLMAPDRIEKDAEGKCRGRWVRPQMIGPYRSGRPSPLDNGEEPVLLECDVILIAVGQDIESAPFEEFGMAAERSRFLTDDTCAAEGMEGVFAGGDCVTGPATVIKAIAAGKVAAYQIDRYLGYAHTPVCEAERPLVRPNNRQKTGRVNITEREARVRRNDFEHVEKPMSRAEAEQEASRCLRCDYFGCGATIDDTETVYGWFDK